MTSLRMHKLHGHKENCCCICDVTTYAEVCSPSRCLETGCITPFFYCFVLLLLSNGCSCGSAVLVWSKYAAIYKPLIRSPERTDYVSATETSRLMLFRESVAVYCENHTEHRSRDSSVGIATSYGLDD
jgi:hypothetical protein